SVAGRPPRPTCSPYTALFRSVAAADGGRIAGRVGADHAAVGLAGLGADRRAGLDGGDRLVAAVVFGPVVEVVAGVAGVPGVRAHLGQQHRTGGVVGAVAVDRHRAAHEAGRADRRRALTLHGASPAVAATVAGRFARRVAAGSVVFTLALHDALPISGLDGGDRLVAAVVFGPVVEVVAGVAGVPGVRAHLGQQHRTGGVVGAVAVDRHRAAHVEIGRASCREREQSAGGGDAW